MNKLKFIALFLLLITVLLACSSCAIKFHFITDPQKLDWGINHYYVPSGDVDEDGNKKYILYSHETTFINPFYTATITDTTLNFEEGNTVAFVDLNGNTHKGTYEIDKYSKNYYDELVMNFDDGVSIIADYFKLSRNKVTNNYIVFIYDEVEYIFSTMHALSEEELVQKRFEMVEWARKINEGYKLSEEEKNMDFFIIKSVWLGGYPLKYRNHTSSSNLYPSTIQQLQIENGKIQFYCKRKVINDGWKAKGVWINEGNLGIYILIDKNNNMKEIKEPILGDCILVPDDNCYYFYFFE